MLIVGENLRDLCRQHRIVDSDNAFDSTSLCLRLNDSIKEIKVSPQTVVDYGKALKSDWIVSSQVPTEGFELSRNSAILACSKERVHIPLGYFGMVQTKGSLARLFVSVTCNDGQVDPGFNGNVTFEIVNCGPLRVRIPRNAQIAQLFIFRASTKNVAPYSGRYQNAEGPTEFRPA
jgi:dCTP deaminase